MKMGWINIKARDSVRVNHNHKQISQAMNAQIAQPTDTPLGSVHGPAVPILPDASEQSTPALSDLSSRDKPWDVHRHNTDIAASYYAGHEEFHRYSERMKFCSDLLEFGLTPVDEVDTGELKLKLKAARFCRVRTCPVCQWRRSLRWKAKAHQAIPKLVNDYPTARWLFLTLTVRNCEVTELRTTLSHMKASFKRLSELKRWPALGYVRTTEVTRNILDGTAHPHFHCLLMVRSGYFKGKGYIKQAEWSQLWQKSARLDYEPMVDVRAISKAQGPEQAIPEVFKYCTKSSDLLADKDWFLEYTHQMHNTRSISTGGILKQYFKELEKEPENLIGEDEEEDQAIDDQLSMYFGWKRQESKYRMKD